MHTTLDRELLAWGVPGMSKHADTGRTLNEKDMLVLAVGAALIGGSLIYANIAAGVKLINFLGLLVPAGTIAYAITFAVTDVVDEVYGKRAAMYLVWGGLAASIGYLFLVGIDMLLPAANDRGFADVFSPQFRIVAASIIAYLISQHHDVWAFWRIREATKGRFLWLRNNVSTIVSQLIDSSIFLTLGLYGVIIHTPGELFTTIMSMWLAKVVIALADTPFVYAGVILVNRLRGLDEELVTGFPKVVASKA